MISLVVFIVKLSALRMYACTQCVLLSKSGRRRVSAPGALVTVVDLNPTCRVQTKLDHSEILDLNACSPSSMLWATLQCHSVPSLRTCFLRRTTRSFVFPHRRSFSRIPHPPQQRPALSPSFREEVARTRERRTFTDEIGPPPIRNQVIVCMSPDCCPILIAKNSLAF